MLVTNLFKTPNTPLKNELFDDLVQGSEFLLERIVSRGHTTADGEWYDQEMAEWVILLKGSGTIEFEEDNELVELSAGDYILIPKNCRHRVTQTSDHTDTIWLALHFKEK